MRNSKFIVSCYRQMCFYMLLIFSYTTVSSQKLPSPLDIPIILSGNFGELRSNHFHSGIDFKTQGRIGLPIRAVKEAFVSRISVSPRGYGRALYLQHPDGTTSVYAHLNSFAAPIENFVRDSQYIKESFPVDLSLSEEIFHIKTGQIIGYGGNTGSSGGPHLHFEIRDTQTNEPIDPLPFFKTQIKDTRKPQIRAMMIYPQEGKGIVNGKTEKQVLKISKDKAGKDTVQTPINAWGEIAMGIKAYDAMNDATNIYGVRELSLSVDDKIVFHYILDRFSFAQTRYLNSFVDWEEWILSRKFYMKSVIEPGNLLNCYVKKDADSNNGIINIEEERSYNFKYALKDLYDNTSILEFEVVGQKQDIPTFKPFGTYYAHSKDNITERDGVKLSIPKGNLYTDIYFTYSMLKNYTPYSHLYKLHKRWPLHKDCPLEITLCNDSFPDKEKYGITAIGEKKISWIGGVYQNGTIKTNIRELGAYTVSIDTTSPKILPILPNKWAIEKKISFKISDNLSGIAQWKGTLNGEFVLFEYDAKKALLFCEFDPKRMSIGKQKLELHVFDACGNEQSYKANISW